MAALPIGLLAALSGMGAVHAQTSSGAVAPGQLEKRFEAPTQRAPDAGPILPRIEPQAAPSRADEVRFTLTGVVVEGATAFDEAEFVPLYRDLIAREVTLADAFRIAAAVTAKYRERGYILSRAIVPEQQVSLGLLRIRVIEGFLERIVFRGAVEGPPELLQAYAEKITSVQPLRRDVFERYILLMDDLPGVSASYEFVQTDADTGAHALFITLRHDSFEGFARLDNRGSRYVGPYQAWLGAAAHSILGLYESTQARFITASDTEELAFFDVSHLQNLGTEGTRLTLSASRSRSLPGYRLEDDNIESHGLQAEIALNHPLIRAQKRDWFVSARFGAGEFRRDEAGTRAFEDSLRVVRLGTRYGFSDEWNGRNLIAVEASRGLSTLGASEAGAALLSRTGGRPDFLKGTLELSRYQALAPQWGVQWSAMAQKSAHKLLLSEQIGIGGEAFGRAYDPSEITGDDGAATRIELQRDATLKDSVIRQYQIFGYYDVGRVWTRGSDATSSLSSVGIGVRALAFGNLLGSLEVAQPLTRSVEALGNDGEEPRLFFTLTATF